MKKRKIYSNRRMHHMYLILIGVQSPLNLFTRLYQVSFFWKNALVNVEFRKLETNFRTVESYESSIFGETSKYRRAIYWKECWNRCFYYWRGHLCWGKIIFSFETSTTKPVSDIMAWTFFSQFKMPDDRVTTWVTVSHGVLLTASKTITFLGFCIEKSLLSAWRRHNNRFNRDY